LLSLFPFQAPFKNHWAAPRAFAMIAPPMDLSPILDSLNDAQRAAVTAPVGPVLVLAGAGSGKTRVLTHRIAWVIQTEGASPHSILAVTFTNKAAHEMRGRIERLLGVPGGAMWVGTFHGIAHRLLRLHWRDAKLPQSFQILDGEDQLRMIKKIVKAMELDEARWVPREIQWFINHNKDEGHRPSTLKDGNDPTRRQLIRLYTEYEAQCQRAGVVDFAELLLRAYELWLYNPQILSHYQHRFRHVLIDEFQDTNAIQYAWSLLVAGKDGAPFVVGDDDQSIYRWRGARVENLTRFSKDYPAAKLFRLEQNYRSTGNILKAANALIANNTGRLGKNLWTQGSDGERIKLYAAFNERDEAEFVMHRIREWANQGGARRDCRHPVPLQRAVARVRRNLHVGAHSVQGVWRPAVLRACGNQGCAGVSAHHHQSRRRRLIRARGEPSDARHRQQVARPGARAGESG
jgi:DNA helicase-2/ATP-dependent DNA helicase PcrA